LTQDVDIGIVVIGRNEGERLRRCLVSVIGQGRRIVYVDSGSADGSVALARSLGVDVIQLDPSRPFAAGTARNAGLKWLLQQAPDMEFVQFVDGDCELSPGWIHRGGTLLRQDPSRAAVCGGLRERHPEASIYNYLCQIEWDRPAGEVKACGGVAMMRVLALLQVDGFRECLVAGEEPELCFRLRQGGWRIWRDDAEMALHDANMTRFSQWWRRAVRSGHAYAEGAWLHWASPERYNLRQVASAVVWGGLLPLGAVAGVFLTSGLSLLSLLTYPVLGVRIAHRNRLRCRQARDMWAHACFTLLAKFAQVAGICRFILGRLRGRQGRLIEYKDIEVPGRSTCGTRAES
jgi:GT2 family glycosyltransferase